LTRDHDLVVFEKCYDSRGFVSLALVLALVTGGHARVDLFSDSSACPLAFHLIRCTIWSCASPPPTLSPPATPASRATSPDRTATGPTSSVTSPRTGKPTPPSATSTGRPSMRRCANSAPCGTGPPAALGGRWTLPPTNSPTPTRKPPASSPITRTGRGTIRRRNPIGRSCARSRCTRGRMNPPTATTSTGTWGRRGTSPPSLPHPIPPPGPPGGGMFFSVFIFLFLTCPTSCGTLGPLPEPPGASPPPFLKNRVPPQRLPKIKRDPLNNFMGPLPKILSNIPPFIKKVLFWFFFILFSICYLLPIVKILTK